MNRFRRGGRIRFEGLLLTLVFTVSAFALMWTAVGCFDRINRSYDSASEGMAAAQFIANRIRSAAGDIRIYTENGEFCRMTVESGDFEDIIRFENGALSEALVPAGGDSRGETVLSADRITVEMSEASANAVAVSAYRDGEKSTAYAAVWENIEFINGEE